MKIDCYLSKHCGSFHELRDNLGTALAALGMSADVEFHTIYYDEAVALGIPGSPTIRLNGQDLFEMAGSPGIA